MRKRVFSRMILLILLLGGCGLHKVSGPMPDDEFLVIAHRGASAYLPENTLEAFSLAEKLDAPYIELDIHLTKDGEMVVMHDDDVSETTEANGEIAGFTLAELKRLSVDARDGKIAVSGPEDAFAVPTLKEVFDQFGDQMNYVVELKDPGQYPGIEEKLVALLKQYELIGFDESGRPKAVVHSFSEKGLKRVHELEPAIPLLQLISFDEDEEAKLSDKKVKDLRKYAAGVGISYEALTPPFVNEMHRQDLVVYAYTVNDAEAALKMKSMGVNGIHTDHPDLLKNSGK
ncbi:glycerophosphoryl diester phosphodiesterase [Bacillus sp. OxB-1]|uniref:glycerophosphodiester phosphodiesterase n=1 Tax=Bacillus sp. (strain OxB-1) TaxID=98228 RepID=UPI0005821A69|nr:glycerophosphodiester phosphodiesterase family protein [Bacillus sp. OxB-1]BAQ10137.1 glycerophosphoryl diester phosphodiesterase [Bacillus sp. OxB-1]